MLKKKIKDLEALNDQKSAEIAQLNQKFSEYRAQGS
jgi:prefoldin subunit 5